MPVTFVERDPSPNEIEKFRLILSTYQDGTGMLVHKEKPGATLPGWRDFERSIALAFGGEAQESKSIFDVLISDPENPHVRYGISCKMRGELNRIERDGRVTIELSNSAGKFWDHLYTREIYQTNYRERPRDVGSGLLELIDSWHKNPNQGSTFRIDVTKSFYLVLSWNRAGWYQLHQFPLKLPNPELLSWYCPVKKTLLGDEPSRRIIGRDQSGIIFEWYGESGGQLKYYPLVGTATWASGRLRLEPLGDNEHGILAKAAAYFPELWKNASEGDL